MKKFKPMSSLVELFLAYDISFPEAVALFPSDMPYIHIGREKRLFDLYYWRFGPKSS